jgi:hypothetical protein
VSVGSVAAGARAESLRAAAPIRPRSLGLASFFRLTYGLRSRAAPQLIR